MKKILIATEKPFAAEAVTSIKEIIKKANYELILLEGYTDKQLLLGAIANVDAAIFRSDLFDEEVLNAGKNLKIIVRAGAGVDNIDLKAATANNICAMNTPGQNANAVAELVFGMVIYAIRNNFNGSAGTELKDKKLGIHAYGNVGKNVARIAKGFGMDVYAYDPFAKDEAIEKDGVRAVKSVEDLYKTCQYVSLHIPATKETTNSIDYKLLTTMPKDAVLINTARQEIINESELEKVFADRSDFRYVTDIMPKNNATLAEKYGKRYFSTPKKTGAQTEEANINAGIAAANQIVDFFENGNEKFRVNK